jgi:putative transposase
MGRQRRVWISNRFYHIVCRGNRRDSLFQDPGDFLTFLYILQQVHDKIPFEISAFCLMTNHYHLQLRSTKQPVSKVMSLINKRYANYYNTKYRLTGHVFEKRYYDKEISSRKGMIEVSCYIHLNPVEAKMVNNPVDYPWSSYSYYKGIRVCPYEYFKKDVIFDCFTGSMKEKGEKYCKEVMVRMEREVMLENCLGTYM